jgi:hypothetical protein
MHPGSTEVQSFVPPTEGLPRFGRSPFGGRDLKRGVTAVVRVKNEARKLRFSLPALIRSTDAVILVDNQSSDGTAETARSIASALGLSDRLRILDYPYALSRCGPEHLATPPDSVHSLVYFNNWAFSHVRTTYALKWDGDMALTAEGAAQVRDFCWQVGNTRVNLLLPRHPLYIESEQVGYLDLGLHNVEHYGHPILSGYCYVKAFEWESLRVPPGSRNFTLPAGSCLELKHLDEDEFSHWTDHQAFATSFRTRRKRRDFATFRAINAGRWDACDRVFRIEAPAGVHIVDHVAREWLPRAARPLVHDQENAAPS